MAKAQKKPAAADHNDNPLSKVFGGIRRTFLAIGLLSGAVNILMLTGPMFMLQIYDRVLASGSLPTLAALFGLVAALFLFLGLFDLLRTRITSRMGYNLDVELMPITKRAWILAGLSPNSKAGRPLTDLTVFATIFFRKRTAGAVRSALGAVLISASFTCCMSGSACWPPSALSSW